MGNTERMLIFCLFFLVAEKPVIFVSRTVERVIFSICARKNCAQDALDYAGKLVYIFLFFWG